VANSFSLTRKTDMNKGPVSLRQVDEEICAHFNVVPQPHDYYHSWFDTIGFELTSGMSFADIIRRCHDDMDAHPLSYKYYKRKLEVAEYLDAHFISDRWSWEIKTINESTEDKLSTVIAQLDKLLSDAEMMRYIESKLNENDNAFIERVAEISLLLETLFNKYPGLRERHAEHFKERLDGLTKRD